MNERTDERMTQFLRLDSCLFQTIVESGKKAVVLRDCASSLCGIKESKPKSFKCCIRCREEGVLPRAYYCGRDCQVEDWNLRHLQFHKDRKAAKKSLTKEEPDPMYTVD